VVPIKVELGRPNGDVLVGAEGNITVGPDGRAFMNAEGEAETTQDEANESPPLKSGTVRAHHSSIRSRKE